MKKIGLCSLDEDFAREYAHKLGLNFVVFTEMVFDFIKENIAKIKNPNHVKDVFLPTIQHIKNISHDALLLDMEVLMHDECVAELRNCYTLVNLQNAEPKSTIEQIMVDDYKARLSQICQEVI